MIGDIFLRVLAGDVLRLACDEGDSVNLCSVLKLIDDLRSSQRMYLEDIETYAAA